MNTFQRAVSKLGSIRHGAFHETPVNRNPYELFFGGIVVLALFIVPPAILVALAIAGIGDINPLAAGLVFAGFVAVGALLTYMYLRDDTSTPLKAVERFMQHAIGKEHGRAYLLLVDADKDNTPRRFGGKEYSFANIEGFRDYWNAVREKGGDWGKVALDPNHRVNVLDHDIAQVEFAFLDMFGRRGATHTKLVVHIEGEWRIFTGEWCGQEERDVDWVVYAGEAAPTPKTSEADIWQQWPIGHA